MSGVKFVRKAMILVKTVIDRTNNVTIYKIERHSEANPMKKHCQLSWIGRFIEELLLNSQM